MTIKMTFEFETMDSALEFLGGRQQNISIVPVGLTIPNLGAPEKKRAGRKPKVVKEKTTAAAPAGSPLGRGEPEAAAVAPTMVEVRAALNKVAGTSLGLNGAVAVVAEFKDAKGQMCRRVSSLQPSDYVKVIARCEAQAAA